MNKLFNGKRKKASDNTAEPSIESISSVSNPIAEKLKKELEKISVDKPKRKYIKVQFN